MKVRAVPEHNSSERSFVFDGFCLVPRRQLLLHGGERVRIGGRALDVLTLLVERAGELVSHADLEARAWPDTFVHACNLKVHIVALRRILCSATGDTREILNVPGRGYRFTRPVASRGRATEPGARPRTSIRRAVETLSRLFGREEDIGRLLDALAGHSPVTVVGADKTTLALAVAAKLARRFRAPPHLVRLAPIGS